MNILHLYVRTEMNLINVICYFSDRDIRIIDDASKFRRGSPSKELLLRVAANSNQQLTLRDLLTDLYNLNLNEASRVLMEDLCKAQTYINIGVTFGLSHNIISRF